MSRVLESLQVHLSVVLSDSDWSVEHKSRRRQRHRLNLSYRRLCRNCRCTRLRSSSRAPCARACWLAPTVRCAMVLLVAHKDRALLPAASARHPGRGEHHAVHVSLADPGVPGRRRGRVRDGIQLCAPDAVCGASHALQCDCARGRTEDLSVAGPRRQSRVLGRGVWRVHAPRAWSVCGTSAACVVHTSECGCMCSSS